MTTHKAIEDALSVIVMREGYAAVFAMEWMKRHYDPATKTAKTDGQNMWFGDWFVGRPLKEQVFVEAHEILHAMLDHPQQGAMYARRGLGPDMQPYSARKANKAMDYVVNACLAHMQLGQMPQGGLFRSLADADRTWQDIYCELPDEPEGDDGDHGGFDEHAEPEPGQGDPGQQQAKEDALARAAASQDKLGDLPGALRRRIQDILNPPRPWRDLYREFMLACAGKDESSWRRLHRRSLWMPPNIPRPGKSGHQIDTAVITVDVSGSIDEATLAAFMAETRDILGQLRPRETWVIFWDTVAVAHQIEEPEDLESLCKDVPGGGGTVYDCALTLIDNLGLEPTVVTCLTDGYVSCSKAEVPYPHVTITTGSNLPFGRNIPFTEVQ